MRMNHRKSSSAGFSLVEMLVVIAIIGVIAAIAIPNIGSVNDSAKDARNRRNAQSIATVFASAQAAGLNFGEGKETKSEVISAVIAGGTVEEGSFSGSTFKIPTKVSREISEDDGAAKYLTWDADSGILIYGQDVEVADGGGGGDAPAPVLSLSEQLAALKSAYEEVLATDDGENDAEVATYLGLLNTFIDTYKSELANDGFDVPGNIQALTEAMGQNWVDSFHTQENIVYPDEP